MPCPRLRHAVGGYLQSRVMKIDYGRVSTRDQNPSAQRDALAAAGCDRVFIDHALMSERTKDGLAAALFRHAFITAALDAGVPLRDVQSAR
jgi:hypothetical protein